MPIRGLVTVALLVCLTAAEARAAALDPYVGKNMFDKVRGRAIYEVPELKKDFIAKFGAQRWATLLSYQTSSPTEAVEDVKLGRLIVTWQCKPSDCPRQAAVVLRPTAEVVGACFAGDHRAEWLGPGWHVDAEEGACSTEGSDIVSRLKAAAARAGH